jgi:hypothetical protein
LACNLLNQKHLASFKKGGHTMKKTIIGTLLLTGLLAGAPAGATTCICVGVANTKICGSGGIGGNFLRVYKDVSDSILNRFLMISVYRTELNSAGQAYDTNTGWFCFK